MKPFIRFVFIFISVAIVLILLFASIEKLINLTLMTNLPDGHTPKLVDLHYKDHLLLAWLHIIPGILFLVLGGYQLIPYFRKRNFALHRKIGKVFLILSAVLFLTALLLGIFYPFGDWIESAVTSVFGLFLLYCIYKAYRAARGLQFIAHRNWVTRLYFVALSVSTIRGFIALFMATGSESVQAVFGIAFLYAFVLHVFLVEVWIRYLAD